MIKLRAFEDVDCDRLISWIPDARFLLQFSGPRYTFPLTREQISKTIKKTEKTPPEHFMFKAVLLPEERVVGHIEFMDVDYDKLSAMLARVLIGDPDARGKGYGKQMVNAAVNYGFNNIGLNEIILGVFDFNHSAISCYEKTGFKAYEFRENSRRYQLEQWNSVMMKITRNDWVLSHQTACQIVPAL